MKRVFGGFAAICAVLVYDQANAVCGDAAGCQTIRMTPGTPQVVSNTFTLGGGCSSGGCVNTSVNGGPRYVVGTPVVSSGYLQRGYVPVQSGYRQPTSYQRTNYVAAPNVSAVNTRTTTYQQSRQGVGNSGTSGAYVYNKGGSGYVGMNLDINLLN